ncbi:MAG: MBL fold metallo-hydrolase [Candidatus Aenigmatarchaeota archaeon]|nr:MAG: MBL fold metallo-hydrolase [Candidatus Aenigmarchaeota archaeon]
MELVFLGGAREVGRLGLLVESGNERVLLDYGIEVQDTLVPLKPKLPLNAVFLSHCHLDHSGYLPALYTMGYKGNIYATRMTHELAFLLLKDSLNVQRKKDTEPLYLQSHLKEMKMKREFLEINEGIETGNFNVTFRSSGHIPGSVSITAESEGKRLLFTGDIKFIDTKLMKGAYSDFKDIDVLVSESTYSYKNHPDREELEKKLKEIIETTYHNGGISVLPTFAVSRTQELLLILHETGVPVYLDGMGIEVTVKILNHPDSVRNADKLRKAFKAARKIRKNAQRYEAIKEPCAVITTAGMLNGGPVGFYMKKLHKKENCSLILTGYQVEGTVGRTLLDTGRYVAEGLDVKPRMRTEFLDFSAHTDHDHLIEFYKKTSPEKIVLMHGEHTEEFAEELKEMGFNAYAPETGETIKV